MRKASPWYLDGTRQSRVCGKATGSRERLQGYSTGAEMALEVFQARKRATAIFTRQGLAMSGSAFLPHFSRGASVVLHGELPWNWTMSLDGITGERGRKTVGST